MENQNKIPNITGIRIREMRLEKNWTQKDLANKLGLKNETAIANYESGYSIPKDEVKSKLCEIFNCTMDYLMGNSNFKTNKDILERYLNNQYKIDLNNAFIYSSVKSLLAGIKDNDDKRLKDILVSSRSSEKKPEDTVVELKEYIDSFPKSKRNKVREYVLSILEYISNCNEDRNSYHAILKMTEGKHDNSSNSSSTSNYYMCPVYGRIAAGQPNWAEECMEGKMPIDPELMNIINPEECYFLKVNGESMNKVIKNGAYALIRKTDWVENGEIAVVLVNGFDATLKKFTKQGDLVILEPMSDDPNYTTQVYNKDTEIKIIGKYIGKMEMN